MTLGRREGFRVETGLLEISVCGEEGRSGQWWGVGVRSTERRLLYRRVDI